MAFNRDGGSRFGGNKGGFRSGGRDGGKPSFGKKNWGNRNDGDREMFKATCADCGKTCDVPFRPSGGKPVYCNDCFGSKRSSSGDKFPRRDFGGDRTSVRPSFGDHGNDDTKKQFADLNTKIDRLVRMMENMLTDRGPIVVSSESNEKSEVSAKAKAKAPAKKTEIKAPKKKAPTKVAKKPTAKKLAKTAK